jgi:hypothetical protein
VALTTIPEGCLLIAPPWVGPVIADLDADGTVKLSATVPATAQPDLLLYAQSFVNTAGDFATSNGLRIYLRP